MGLRQTLVLATVAGGLGALVWWTGRKDEETVLDEGLEIAAIGERPILSAERLWVRGQPKARPLRFARRDGDWRLIEPVDDLASMAMLEQLATPIDGARLTRVYAADELTDDILAQTGLDEPRATLRVDFGGEDDADDVELAFGAEDPLRRGVYVMRGADVFLGSAAMVSALQGSAEQFRESRIFRNVPRSTRALKVRERRTDGTIDELAIERRSRGAWRIVKPIDAPADTRSVALFLTNMLGQRADSFVDGNLERDPTFGPEAEPDFLLEVAGDAGAETVRMWRETDAGGTVTGLRAIHRPRDRAFRLGAVTAEGVFRRAVDSLRQRVLLDRRIDDVQRIVLDAGAGVAPVVFGRGRSGEFGLVQPIDWPARRMGELLSSLQGLVATGFRDGSEDPVAAGFRPPTLTIRLEGRASGDRTEIQIGRKLDGGYLARRTDEEYLVVVPSEPVDALRTEWTSWVDFKTIYDSGAPEQVRWLTFRRGARVLDYRSDAEGVWRVGDRVIGLDVADVDDVALNLADLGGAAAVTPAALAAAEDTEFLIDLKRPEGARLQTYRVRTMDGRIFVRIEGAAVWFRIGGTLGESLVRLAPPQ